MAASTLSELAAICGADLVGDPGRRFTGAARLDEARLDEVSFCGDARYAGALRTTGAGAVIVPRDLAVERGDLMLLRCEDPSGAFTAVARHFASRASRPAPGVHPTAQVDPRARLEAGVSVGAFCVLAADSVVGARSVLHAHVVIGQGAEIGEDCELFPHVVLYHGVRLGARCIVHSGSVLGADGFGFEPAAPGEPWSKVPQLGNVVIEDDVEVGAGVTIDRARVGATRLARGVKLDDQVHIAHNVRLGRNAMLAAQVGIAGSATIGEDVQIGGQAGIGGHLEIGARVQLAARSGVIGNVPRDAKWSGYPARPHRESLKSSAVVGRVERLLRRVQDLEARLEALERVKEPR